MNARNIIKAEYSDSRNFMTPDRVKVGSIARGRVAYELSRGEGFLSRWRMYGVTVVGVNRHGDTLRLRNLSQLFSGMHAYQNATEYIEGLKGRF